MDTDDYVTQCLLHLTDKTTYRLATEYPISEQLTQVLHTYKTNYTHVTRDFTNTCRTHLVTPAYHGFMESPKYINSSQTSLPSVLSYLNLLPSYLPLHNSLIMHYSPSYPDYLHNSTSLLQDLNVPDDAIMVTIDVAIHPTDRMPRHHLQRTSYTLSPTNI